MISTVKVSMVGEEWVNEDRAYREAGEQIAALILAGPNALRIDFIAPNGQQLYSGNFVGP